MFIIRFILFFVKPEGVAGVVLGGLWGSGNISPQDNLLIFFLKLKNIFHRLAKHIGDIHC